MKTLAPVEPKQRIEILDVLRGFALLGIIFNNVQYLSGYAFTPFDTLKQVANFQINEHFYHFLDIIVTAKFYTLFSFLFATGFSIQLSRHTEDPTGFLKTYRRRLYILLIIGLIHSLIWFGDILFSYALMGFLLIPFRNAKSRTLLRWAICMLLVPSAFDLTVLFFSHGSAAADVGGTAAVHVSYPDMTPETVLLTFQNGSVGDLFFLNIHNLVWKFLGYLPSGGFFTLFGIFLLGYYLASIRFFTEKQRPALFFIISLIVGLSATLSARILGGGLYQWPPTLHNSLFKCLLLAGQIFLCFSYVMLMYIAFHNSVCKRLLQHLVPMGRMALSNYLSQTVVMIAIFYNFGGNLFGRIGIIPAAGIALAILVVQMIVSSLWLEHFRFGPMEWIWRSLTYKSKIALRQNRS
jgi:uncharacterized protein